MSDRRWNFDDEVVDNREPVARALRAYGQALRSDWGSIDGRTCRDDLAALAMLLVPGAASVSYEQAAATGGICPAHQCWPEHCPDTTRMDICPHIESALR